MSNKDSVQRFIFENTDIRGEQVYLQESFSQALAAHDYPEPVRIALGELTAAAVLLSTTLKYSGVMTLQAKGSGDISLLMVECSNQNSFRALARWSGQCKGDGFRELLGEGQLVITVDPDKGKRYQGIVPLEHSDLSASLEHYFAQSEQLPTQIRLASDGVKAAGILLQALPAHTETSVATLEESWARVSAFTNTVSSDELLTLDAQTLLYRLYHEEDVRLFDSEEVRFQCSCSRKRSAEIIRGVGRVEADNIISEQGQIEMSCQFCNQSYVFNASDVLELFDKSRSLTH